MGVALVKDTTIQMSKERALLMRLIHEEGTKLKTVAENIGKSSSTISQYLSGKYSGKTADLEDSIRNYLIKISRWEEEEETIEETFYKTSISEIEFIATQDYERVIGICHMCKAKKKLGVVVGAPGTGKTVAIDKFKESEQNVYSIRCGQVTTKKSILANTAKALGIKSRGSASTLFEEIIQTLSSQPAPCLLIYDEADVVSIKVLETIRDIYDVAKVGIVLCGNNSLAEKILVAAEENSDLARLRDRIGYFNKLSGLTENEVNTLLKGINCTAAAKKLLVTIGMKRGLRQLIEALDKLFDVTCGNAITEDLVQELCQIVLSFNS